MIYIFSIVWIICLWNMFGLFFVMFILIIDDDVICVNGIGILNIELMIISLVFVLDKRMFFFFENFVIFFLLVFNICWFNNNVLRVIKVFLYKVFFVIFSILVVINGLMVFVMLFILVENVLKNLVFNKIMLRIFCFLEDLILILK